MIPLILLRELEAGMFKKEVKPSTPLDQSFDKARNKNKVYPLNDEQKSPLKVQNIMDDTDSVADEASKVMKIAHIEVKPHTSETPNISAIPTPRNQVGLSSSNTVFY